jgi:hypothetical protein
MGVAKTLNLIGVCACGRRHDNVGYAPTQRHPVKWLCLACVPNGKAIYKMKTRTLDVYEEHALLEGGDAGGAYLESIGKTDLATLTEGEWCSFLERVLMTYGATMQKSFDAVKETF